jgi:histidinol-phosphatase (PHP family)
MNLQNLHSHTVFCDGADTVEALCQEAWRRGFSSLGLSGHAPLLHEDLSDTAWHMSLDGLDRYLEEVYAARQRWQGRLEVFCGVEADFIPGICGPADRFFRELGLDFIIGSVHYVVPPADRPFTVDGPPEETDAGVALGCGGDGAVYAACYWGSVKAMIRAGGFDIVGHFDLIKKNNTGEKYFSAQSAWYREMVQEASALLAGSGLVAEVNTGGLSRGAISELYPSEDILKTWSSLGVPVLINSDAHRSADLDACYPLAAETLQRTGFRSISVFRGRKNGKALWAETAL